MKKATTVATKTTNSTLGWVESAKFNAQANCVQAHLNGLSNRGPAKAVMQNPDNLGNGERKDEIKKQLDKCDALIFERRDRAFYYGSLCHQQSLSLFLNVQGAV
jgi:hypothetical protein